MWRWGAPRTRSWQLDGSRHFEKQTSSLCFKFCIRIVGDTLCASTAYLLWWHKPQGAQVSILAMKTKTPMDSSRTFKIQVTDHQIEMISGDEYRKYPRPVFVGAFLVVGGVHSAAWNFPFPSPTERLLWRIACVIVTCTPLVIFLVGRQLSYWKNLALCLLMSIYVTARFYLVVEMFVSLRSVPIEVYHQSSWIDFIPHL